MGYSKIASRRGQEKRIGGEIGAELGRMGLSRFSPAEAAVCPAV